MIFICLRSLSYISCLMYVPGFTNGVPLGWGDMTCMISSSLNWTFFAAPALESVGYDKGLPFGVGPVVPVCLVERIPQTAPPRVLRDPSASGFLESFGWSKLAPFLFPFDFSDGEFRCGEFCSRRLNHLWIVISSSSSQTTLHSCERLPPDIRALHFPLINTNRFGLHRNILSFRK